MADDKIFNLKKVVFLEKAEKLKPKLYEKIVKPQAIVVPVKDSKHYGDWRMAVEGTSDEFFQKTFKRHESIILDFGDHLVGHLSFKIEEKLSPQDAPLKLRLSFGEMPFELVEPFEHYSGWLSASWLQEELIFVDSLPAEINLPRRYCFRYLKIEVLDTSKKYGVQFTEMSCVTKASANDDNLITFTCKDEILNKIDRTGVLTLKDCMQTVYEDGPKRDRRLWIGDLRLQALVNYETYRDVDVLKRCIYLFAGLTDEDGRVPSCIFEKPTLHADNIYLYDYSLFFISILFDYFNFSQDKLFIEELWATAYRQLELAMERIDKSFVVKDSDEWWSFIDWHDNLNKQAPTQGVLIYCMRQAQQLAEILEKSDQSNQINSWLANLEKGALSLWDSDEAVFVSGAEKQVSWASQVWMVLAEVLSTDESKKLLKKMLLSPPQIDMITPYMVHHLVDALLLTDLEKEALDLIRSYWGDMIDYGADRFFELYNPENRAESPYGGNQVNSFCHAWSCTPTYFIRNRLRRDILKQQ